MQVRLLRKSGQLTISCLSHLPQHQHRDRVQFVWHTGHGVTRLSLWVRHRYVRRQLITHSIENYIVLNKI
jgi:hypothetical protein